jgi:hypothetical protein
MTVTSFKLFYRQLSLFIVNYQYLTRSDKIYIDFYRYLSLIID